jgi:hypothetical protein
MPIRETVEQPLNQRSTPILGVHPNIKIVACAYCQVGHEFKNCPSMDDKL